MNGVVVTKDEMFGPVEEISRLALDAIRKLHSMGLPEKELHDFEDRWMRLIRIPGSSHFPSRSSSSSEAKTKSGSSFNRGKRKPRSKYGSRGFA